LDQPSASAETCADLAELYEHLDRLEEASQLVDRALHLDGDCALALLLRARLDRRAGRLEEAENCLRQLLPKATETFRIRGWYELGAVLDRQGRYDEAMLAVLEAKAILKPQAPPLLARLEQTRVSLKALQTHLSGDLLQRWIDSVPAPARHPRLVLLCGYARSGTTLLEQVLDSHPDIVSAEETHIFVDHAFEPLKRGLPEDALMLTVLESAQHQALQRSRENYFREVELLLGHPLDGRLLIDKNPALTFFIPAFIRVFPEVRFLVTLRDPRDVCVSSFLQAQFPLATETAALLTLEGTVEEYCSKMEVWKTMAPLIRNLWLAVRYRDMVQDLESVARRVLDFLGVPWDTRVLRFYEHARQKIVRSITHADVKQPIYKGAVGRWRNYEKHLQPYLNKLEPFVQAFGYE
jgi:hypothetical protein